MISTSEEIRKYVLQTNQVKRQRKRKKKYGKMLASGRSFGGTSPVQNSQFIDFLFFFCFLSFALAFKAAQPFLNQKHPFGMAANDFSIHDDGVPFARPIKENNFNQLLIWRIMSNHNAACFKLRSRSLFDQLKYKHVE